MPCTLPPRQFRILRYLEDRDRAAVRDVAADLRMNRTDAMNALRLLAVKGLASADPAAFPTSFAITDEGREALAAAKAEGGGR